MAMSAPSYCGSASANGFSNSSNVIGAPDGQFAIADVSGATIQFAGFDFMIPYGCALTGIGLSLYAENVSGQIAYCSFSIVDPKLSLAVSGIGAFQINNYPWAWSQISISQLDRSYHRQDLIGLDLEVDLTVQFMSTGSLYIDSVRGYAMYAEPIVDGGPWSVGLIYGRTDIQFRDRRGKTVMRTSRRRPSSEIVIPERKFILPRKAA